MQHQQLFIPFFCSNCHQLAFILKNPSDDQDHIVEYHKNSWKSHLCYNVKGDAIWSHNPSLPKIESGIRKLPVNVPDRVKKRKQSEFSLGVIIELPEAGSEDSKNAFFKVLTLESTIIHVRNVKQQEILSAGLLIDLSQAKKVGNDKYRIPELILVTAGIELEKESGEFDDFFSFSLSANDQEQLESFVDRFLKILSKNNLYLQSIIPMEIRDEKNRLVYQRRLTISSAFRLQKAIETITFPESIQISVH